MAASLSLEELEIYQLAREVGENVWNVVDKWKFFPKKTVGAQFVDAADSIAANIAEGYGRYFYKERRQFCYYSRGSLLETKTWATKAVDRKLISEVEFEALLRKLKALHLKLNDYIKKLRETAEKQNI